MSFGLTVLSDGVEKILNCYATTTRVVGSVWCSQWVSTRLIWSGRSGSVTSGCHGFVVMKR